MRITSATVINAKPSASRRGYNPVFLRLTTDQGLVGWGEAAATYHPACDAIATQIGRVVEDLIGADATTITHHWSVARGHGACYGHGSVTAGAAAAVELALWDLRGKSLGVPVHQLLGGPVRTMIRTYANGWCYDLETPEQYAEAARQVIGDGFTTLKFDPFRYHAGGFAPLPSPGQSTVRTWLAIAEARLAAVRAAIGDGPDLILECHAKFPVDIARLIITRLAPYGLAFVEEPIDAEDPGAMADLARSSPVPLAAGERLNHRSDFRHLFANRAIALAQPDVGTTGIGESLRIASAADTYRIAFQPHNANGPVLTAATAQVDAVVPNLRFQEVFPYRPDDYLAFVRHPLERTIVDGYLPIPQGPGLGVEVDETVMSAFPSRTVGTP